MEYKMISEVKAKTKIFRSFSLKDLAVVLIFVGVGYLTREMVNPSHVIAYMVFNVLVGIIAILPCPFTHRKMYTFIIHSLIRNRATYHSVWEMPKNTLTSVGEDSTV